MAKAVMEIGYKYYYFWQRKMAFSKLKKGDKVLSFLKGERVAKTLEKMRKRVYEKVAPLACEGFVTAEPVPFAERTSGKRIKIKEGTVWAEKVFDCAWFHVTGKMPAGESLKFLIDCGGEGLVFTKDGKVTQGITSRYSQFSPDLGLARKIVVDPEPLTGDDGTIDFWIDCGANDLFGNRKNDSKVSALRIVQYNKELDMLGYDVEVLFDVYAYNYNDDFEKKIIRTLTDILPACKTADEKKAAELRKTLAPLLAEKNDKNAFTFHAIGHAHLDLAWLWPLRESYRKGGRTFANQLRNIKNYDGYIFGASQAQLYDWVKRDYPDVYAEVKKQAALGRWDVQGATWVEPDSFCISGESMIRQFYYGKKFFKDEFGQDMKIFWVPDSFGYSGCLPTVMNLAGAPYFLTQKMSWNKYNKFPYHTFYWEGLDGSRVLAHMLPECTYNGPMNTYSYKKAEKYYYERKYNDEAMALFGIGDGGAGPGVEHLERGKRMADLKDTPKVDYKKSADFFANIDDGSDYPVHKGELYLEKHQGTQTSHSKNKWYNRKCEFALKNYDLLAAIASEKGIDLPLTRERIDEIWKEILLYQFHDILPGSSIDRVYTESEARYAVIYKELTAAIRTLESALAGGTTVFNHNPYSYRLPYKADGKWYDLSVGAFSSASVASLSEAVSSVKAEGDTIENEFLRVKFGGGAIVSLFDKALEKEFVPHGGKTAVISKYVDEGDAWDFPKDYREKKKDAVCTAFTVDTDGAEAYAEATYALDENVVKQRFSLLSGSRQVTVKMNVNCKQEKSMLRIAFPVDIYTSECTFNVQFGHLTRRTTEENSIEKAQFEVNGQKFVDMSEKKYGVSVLNDCKYGFRCKGNVMDMNLIRTPKKGPSHRPDQGEHEINYAILVHEGNDLKETYKAAYLLNNPLSLVEGKGAFSDLGYSTDNENIVVEEVKTADDGKGIIARVYNSTSVPQTANLAFAGKKAVCRTDIFENKIGDASAPLTLGKFELAIVRFE